MADRSDHPDGLAPVSNHQPPDRARAEHERQHSTPPSARTADDRDRDALELHEIETQDDEAGTSTASISSGEYRVTTHRTGSRNSQRTVQSRAPRKGVAGYVQRFWTRSVVLTVPQKSNRDHFGTQPAGWIGSTSEVQATLMTLVLALERTFLAYIRTSVILAMQGVLVAQLFRLQHQTASNSQLGYYEVGVPLSVACHCAAVLVAFMGAHRFFKQQNAVALGTVYAGGWELYCIGGLIGLVSSSLSLLMVGVLLYRLFFGGRYAAAYNRKLTCLDHSRDVHPRRHHHRGDRIRCVIIPIYQKFLYSVENVLYIST